MASSRDDNKKSTLSNIGSLWRTRGGSNRVVASGKLQMEGRDGPELSVLLMKNDKDGNEKRPDFRLVLVEEEAPTTKKSPPKNKKQKNDEDDIPF